MTVLEMQDNFQSKLSKFDDIKGIQYGTSEISRFLTEAQNHLVDVYSERFEFDERVKKYLSKIVKTGAPNKITNFLQSFDNSTVWELPSDVKRVVHENVLTNKGNLHVKPVRLNYVNKNIGNPFKKPNFKFVWRLDITNDDGKLTHILIQDTEVNIQAYYITYIKNPKNIDIASGLNCELHVQTHEDIVNLAVERAVAEARARIELMKESLPLQTSEN